MASTRYESDSYDTSILSQPLAFEFSGRTASNRFMKAAMTERMASWDAKNLEVRGVPSRELIKLYKIWRQGNICLMITGNLMIETDHIAAAGNCVIPRESSFSGERFEAFRAMAAAGKKHGSLLVGQVNHPGRQVSSKFQKNPISASSVQLEGRIMGATFEKPRAATKDDIDNIVNGFAHAAEFLERAGYDGIQLNAAHGYLLAQFLSCTTNHRTDQYGGSVKNRTQIIVEIAEAIRARVASHFIISIKLNSVEFQEKGLNPEEAREICSILEEKRFDFVELTGGTFEKLAFGHQRDSTKKREGFFLEFAELIAPVFSKTKTYITGGFKTVGAMNKALEAIDGVGLARTLAQEPRFCKDILNGRFTGARKQATDDNDFGITNIAAGAQLVQIGKDEEPIDLSSQANLDALMKDLGVWIEQTTNDSGMKFHGYANVTSVEAVPYGTSLV